MRLLKWLRGLNDLISARACRTTAILCSVMVLSACSLADLVSKSELPSGVLDPSVAQTESGAIAVYYGVLQDFANVYGNNNNNVTNQFIGLTGLLSDELQKQVTSAEPFPATFGSLVDARLLGSDDDVAAGNNVVYALIHQVRVRSRDARAGLRKYGVTTSPALVGHLFAVEGLTITMLAELYCSGIPLSTIQFESQHVLTRGFTTAELYAQALSLFDSAEMYLGDSVRLQHFASLARSRTLLGMGRIMEARDAVQGVPSDYVYDLQYIIQSGIGKYVPQPSGIEYYGDREGGNGLPFRTGHDPRTLLPQLSNTLAPLTLATGVEARLIEAEALLAAGDATWLPTLNRIRTTCMDVATCPTPAPPGSGNVDALPPLTDPAPGQSMTDTAASRQRRELLFAERAYWLFLTGRRQGDLRRLIRVYQHSPSRVYPVGLYWTTNYGTSVNLPVPKSERTFNRLYRGCEDRNA